MERLVAVEIKDTDTGYLVSGYKARLKNRLRVWSFEVDREDKEKIPELVSNAEETRKRTSQAQGELT